MAILSIKLEMNIMETMTKMKITKTQLKQIIKEEIEKILNENAGGYYVKHGAYGSVKFYDPEGNILEDDMGYSLRHSDMMEVLENDPAVELFSIISKRDLENHRAGSRFPYPDLDETVFVEGKGIKDLFELYLKYKIDPNARVVDQPEADY